MKLLVGVSALFLAASCPVPNPPNPNPTPTPIPTPDPTHMVGQNCAENNLVCNCVDFPPPGQATCVVCDPTSPTGVKSIGIVPICPPVIPTPEPTPTPTPTPTPVPPSSCSIPDHDAVLVSPRPVAQFSSDVNHALQVLYGGEVNSRVVINEEMFVSLNKVVAQLIKQGLCAGIQTGADEVCVYGPGTGLAPNQCQGYHTFVCSSDCTKGTVGWAPGSVRDTWTGTVVPPTPIPTPTPTPPGTPVTCPPTVTKFNPLSVRDQSDFIVDATPLYCNVDYCKANGWFDEQGNPRQCCPLGKEGDPNRAICEKLFGPYEWTYQGNLCGGNVCFNNNDNPLQERVKKPTTGGVISIKAHNGVSVSGTVPASN